MNEEFTFEDLKRINLDDYDTVVLLVKFLRWCQFDIRNEYEEHWNSHKDRARVEDTICLRSSRSTLEAFSTEHKKQIMDALEQEGYQPMLVRTNIYIY